MEGPQQMMENTESLVPGTGLDSITFLSSLAGSGTGLVSSSLGDSAFAYTLSSLPLSMAGTMAKEQRDIGISGPDLNLAQNTIETLARLTDVQTLKSDLNKQLLEEKGLSPLNILVPAYVDAGQGSPAGGSQSGLPVLHYRPAGSGGDTMLSAINYADNEMLNDSAFDINNSAAAGLNQLDDNFLGLSNPASNLRLQESQGGNAFDLFDGDALSPFGDAGLGIEAGSLQGIENERSTDNAFDDLRGTGKNCGTKKSAQQTGVGSPGKCTAQCPTCGKQFNNVSALAKHRLTHSDERKYLCTVCNKGFKRQDHLNGHQMTHLDKKPFQCQVENCDKGYCDARSLRRHLETYHHLPSDIIQNHVQASMAASGITPPSQRNGKSRSSDGGTNKLTVSDGGVQRIINSPSYSTSSTPSPSPGSGGQNQFFHFEVQANKAGGTGGSVTVKVDPLDAGDIQLHKLQQLQEVALQQQPADQNQSQFQVQFQLQQAPASLLAVVQQAQLQLLQQQQLQQQQQQQKPSEPKSSMLKQQQIKAVTDGGGKAQDSSPQSREVVGDGGSSQQSADSWQDRAQIYNFVGTPGSGDQSPTSVSGDTSPGMTQQTSPSPSPSSAMPSSPLQNSQRPNWSAAAVDKNGDEGKCPVQCNVCQRRFKTIPALNGHMRLHGGYLRKDDNKRSSTKKASTSSSSSSSPSTPTDMGPPPPPPPPPPQLSVQPPAVSPQPQSPTMPSPTAATLQPLPPVAVTATASPQMTDLHAMPTFYLTGTHTLQPVSISHLAAADVLQQQQMLQHQLELQMAQLKEEQDIRSLEEQLKQNIHEQNIQQLSSLADAASIPVISQVQSSPISLGQVSETLANVSQALSPLRAASPQTVHAEHIQRLVEGFQQVEELHRQQQQQQQQVTLHVPQLTALQIQQLQQQHIQLGLPPLQPAQLQQILQEQHLTQQLFQQQTTGSLPHGQSLASMPLGPTHVVLQSPPIVLSSSTASGQTVTVSSVGAPSAGTASPVTSTTPISSITMTPGLPGGVLSNGQQLHLGSSQLVSLPAASVGVGSVLMQASNPSPSHNPHSHLSLAQSSEQQHQQQSTLAGASLATLISTTSPSQHYVGLTQPQLLTSSAESLSVGEGVDVQDVAMSQLMSDFEGGIGSELLQIPHSHIGGQGLGDILSGGVVLGQQSMGDKLPGFQSFQSLISAQGRVTPPSIGHPLLDSIKQDVMLSSAVNSQPLEVGIDHFTGSPANNLHAASIKNTHSELKRRLSADSRLSVPASSTLTAMLNKGASYPGHYLKPGSEEDSSSGVAAAARVRIRSKSGDIHKFMRSKSVDQSIMRPRSSTEESIYRSRKRSGDETFIGRSKSHGEDCLSQSDGAGVFRNPSTLPSPFKIKRKHRPTPLFIPTCQSSFHSRLRSPRLWDGGDTKGRGHTPPPYTPPPMLSPVRSGSGLFWTIQGARPLTPQSAPVSARLSLGRRGSFVEGPTDTIPKDVDESPPPETDIKPHVNVGVHYQAEVPPLIENRGLAFATESKEDLMWDPAILNINSEEDVQSYQDFACCAAVKGNGSNVEYALHLLYLAQGDIQMAMLMLMSDPPLLPVNHGLLSYKYQETESWKSSEIEAFHQALSDFDKDFFNVARRVGTKSVKECIQFYYLWKKVCPDDYKRLRVLRRKRIQSGLYNLRSQQPNSVGPDGSQEQPQDAGLSNPHDEFEYEGSDSDLENQSHASGMAASDTMLPDLAAEAELSSVASSPAAPSVMVHGHDITNMMPHMTSSSVPATPPMVLPHTTAPVMVSMAPGLPPVVPSSSAPPPVSLPPPAFMCDFQGCGATLNSKQSLMRHMRRHLKDTEDSGIPRPPRPKPRPATPSKSPIYDQHGEEIFPCKLCDRVFTKVKSRSAHMKSHKMAEADKKIPPANVGFINPTPPSPMEDS